MATEAQITANRLNCQKSTGPQTPEGKAIASRNSLKHATLARKILVAGPVAGESSNEFQTLCDEYYAALEPVGPLEELLVKQIVKAVWRMGRAEQAESAEITLSLESVANAKDNPKNSAGPNYASDHVPRVLQLAALSPDLDIIDLLAAKDEGCEFVLHTLRQARQMFERDREITMEMVNVCFKPFGNHARSLTDPLTQMMEEVSAHADKPEPAAAGGDVSGCGDAAGQSFFGTDSLDLPAGKDRRCGVMAGCGAVSGIRYCRQLSRLSIAASIFGRTAKQRTSARPSPQAGKAGS